MLKNTANQKWRVLCWTKSTQIPATGKAATITAKLSIDGSIPALLADTNPTETEDGYYLFDLTQSETNGHALDLYPECSDSAVVVIADPPTVYTLLPRP